MKDTFIIFILCVTLCFTSSKNVDSTFNPYEETTYYTVGNGKNFRVGILSDSQLLAYPEQDYYNFTDHLIRSFEVIKKYDVHAIIFPGDVSDRNGEYGYSLFRNSFLQVYPDESTRPIMMVVMGNHDYWEGPTEIIDRQEVFYKGTGEKPFTHKVINGIHFVNWGSEDGSFEYCNENTDWAKQAIEKSLNEDPTKPIFVTTHLPPDNTVYGSVPWGNVKLAEFFKDYEQVISISGHSHYSLIDERSIWQGTYTAINTQSISYTEMETGKENGSVPKDENGNDENSRKNYMGFIMDVDENKVSFQRISLAKDEFYGEPWIIDRPVTQETFRYKYGTRENNSIAPQFQGESDFVVYNKGTYYQLNFKQAFHENLVHSYRVVLEGDYEAVELLYFSDFYLMEEDRSERITLKLPTLEYGIYKVTVYAIESFGKESEPISGYVELD